MDTADSPQFGQAQNPLARIAPPGALGRPTIPAATLRPSPAPSSAASGLNARMVWRALMRHWWQALALWVLGTAALGTLVYLKFKPEYESVGILRIEPSKTDLFNVVRQADSSYMETQVQLIKSQNVLLAAAAVEDVRRLTSISQAEDAARKLEEMVTVTVPNRSHLIRISARSEIDTEPAVIVNAIMENYQNLDHEWANSQTTPLIKSLEDYAKNLDGEIGELKRKLDDYAKDGKVGLDVLLSGVKPAESGQSDESGESTTAGSGGMSRYKVEMEQYARLKNELLNLELEIAKADGALGLEKQRAEASDPSTWIDQAVEQAFYRDPEVAAIVDEIHDAEVLIEQHERVIKKPGDPTLTGLRKRIEGLRAQYSQLWDEKKDDLRARAQAIAQSPDQTVAEAERGLRQLEMERAKTVEMLRTLNIEQQAVGKDTLQAALHRSDLENLRMMRRQVETQLRQLRFDQVAGSRIVEIQPARTSSVPILDKRTRMLALVPLAVLGMVIALCTLLELKAGRVGSPDELSARVPVEVFAVPPLPVVRPSRALRGPKSNDAQFELFVQQLDHLRVALCGEAMSHAGRGRCVLITSATGGEGKTTLAAQLAVRCAEAGASTVLVDADLRRATLGRLFEVPECPGLSDVLRGEANLEDALVAISQVGGCQLLPAGSPETNPNRILRGQRFGPMIEQLRRTFDVIIIDTSPVLPVPDALIMGRYADGVVLAARHDRSRFPLVERANNLLTGAGVPVLGVVINGVQPSGMRYGDYAYTYRSERGPAAGDDDAVHGRVG